MSAGSAGAPTPIPLAAEDRAILDLECPTIVGHTCHVTVLGPDPAAAGPLPAAAVRRRIRDRLAAAPELRYRLGGTATAPAWTPVDDLDLDAHVVDAAGGPHDEAALRRLVADRFARHLDRARPLWAIDVVALADGRTALVWRLHHALADGTTVVRLARTVLYDEQAPAVPGDPGTGPGVSPATVVHEDHRRRRAHLMGVIRREFAVRPGRSPFDGTIGTRRDVAFLDTDLPALHAAARAAGATVNDAVLSVLAGGLRRWLDHQSGSAPDLRVRVPVSLPREGPDVLNRDSAFDLPLPLHVHDPVDRLRSLHRTTTRRKEGGDAVAMDVLLHQLSGVAPPLRRLVDRVRESPRAFAVSVSNVPGPRTPVRVLSRPVRTVRPLAEIGAHHALRVAAMSTGDALGLGLCADPGVVPDLDVLADGLRREVDLLVAATGQASPVRTRWAR